jgi:acyl-CoA dehydrogenase
MSDSRTVLTHMASRLFADLSGRNFSSGWPLIYEAGFASLLVSEDKGGFGGDFGDMFAVMRLAGYYALALPLGETILAHRLLASAGIDRPDGAISIAANGSRAPWGREVGSLVSVEGGELLLFSAEQCLFEEGISTAGEPRDRATFTGAPIARAASDADLYSLGAFLRVAQSAGALDAALAMSVEYANTRVQFGKPLAKLQAVQQNLAAFAAEVAAVNVAGQAAAAALDFGDAEFEIAAAKIRANLAIGTSVAIAHQIHGAIGFTQEYGLHHFTRRLMGWRSEFGNDAYWSVRLGRAVTLSGGLELWREMTARTDAY